MTQIFLNGHLKTILLTSMHSSRMCTARLLTASGGCASKGGGGVRGSALGRSASRGVCLQVGRGSASRGLHLGGWADPLPHVDRQTPIKTLPCPKLRLGAVITTRWHCGNSELFTPSNTQQLMSHTHQLLHQTNYVLFNGIEKYHRCLNEQLINTADLFSSVADIESILLGL